MFVLRYLPEYAGAVEFPALAERMRKYDRPQGLTGGCAQRADRFRRGILGRVAKRRMFFKYRTVKIGVDLVSFAMI